MFFVYLNSELAWVGESDELDDHFWDEGYTREEQENEMTILYFEPAEA